MSNEPVVVCTYNSEFEASLAISALADVGVVACILNPVNRLSYNAMPMAQTPLRLGVRAEDADAAREVLRAIDAANPSDGQVETKRRLGKKARSRPAG